MKHSHSTVHDTAREARDTAREALETARESLESSREQLEEGYARAQDALGEADSWLREQVKETPLLALGLAAVAGYAMGRLLTKRR